MSHTPALDALKARPQWVAWGWEERDGKKTKVPLRIDGKGRASSTDPATWATFAVAEKAYSRFGGRIGFVVSADDPYVGIDLDHCIADGVISAEAQAVVDRFQSYAERTPSGEGLRIWIKGKLPGTRRRRGNVELYDSGRYFTITGQRVGIPDTIEDRQAELDTYCAELFPAAKSLTNGTVRSDALRAQLTDTTILDAARKARNGPAIAALLAGDTSGYSSASEADLALVSLLSFYTQDPTQLDRLFRGSGLSREKWERQDYREATIAKALNSVGETYGPAPQVRHHAPLMAPQADSEGPTGPRSVAEILAMQIEPVRWTLDGMLPEGATLLTGKPKAGKSWIALALALAVGDGGQALGAQTQRGEVLYLALEDGYRRLQSRLKKLLKKGPAPADVYLEIDWPKLDDGGLEQLHIWCQEHRQARLIIIDTLQMVRPGRKRNGDIYGEDYDVMVSLRHLAREYAIAVVIIHHNRKAVSDDPFEMVSGTNGLTGGADSMWVMVKNHGQDELHIKGRDVEEQTLTLKFDPMSGRFKNQGAPDEYRLAPALGQARDLLEDEEGGLTAQNLAEEMGCTAASAAQHLLRLVEDGHAMRVQRGLYVAAPKSIDQLDLDA